MAAKFTPRRGFEEEVARRVAAPVIARALDMLTDAAKKQAPPVKVWVTARDDRVRPSHRHTDGQAIPDNLRFILPSTNGGGNDLARAPRDPSLPIAQRINCRCDTTELPQRLADSIHHSQVKVEGTVVHGTVETTFPRAAESEVGTSEDTAAHYFAGALREVANQLKSGHTR